MRFLLILIGIFILDTDVNASFKAITFNVRYGTANDGSDSWIFRHQILKRYLTQANPDILAVQEALKFQQNFIAKILPNHGVYGVGRDNGKKGERCSIFFNEKTVLS